MNSDQVDSGNAMGNFHANFSTQTVGHLHSGVWGSLPNTDTSDHNDLGISNPTQDIQMLEISEIANTQAECHWRLQGSRVKQENPETTQAFRHVKHTGIAGMFGWSHVYIGI